MMNRIKNKCVEIKLIEEANYPADDFQAQFFSLTFLFTKLFC